LARFSRLKELQPTRPGLDALLDEVRWFLQLQATAPHATSGSAENGLGGAYSGTVRQAGRWPTWLILIPVAVGLIALLLIAFQGRLPWSTAERGTQELYNRGQARLAVGDYEGAYAAFKKLLEVAPDDPEAQLGLVRAERQQTLAQGYAAAEAAIAEEDWDKAASELEKVLAVDANYAGAQAKADFISQRRRLAGLYSDGGRLYDLGRWEEAIAQFQKIRDLDASYRAEAVNEFLFTSYLNAGQALIASAAGGVASVQRAVDYFANALAI
jgi:tetratricopeptide (TPR) repeat protein